MAWSIATFATLLSLFAWLPWIYPQAALMTPYGQLQSAPNAVALNNPDPRIKLLEDQLAALQQQTEAKPADLQAQATIDATLAATIKHDSVAAATAVATQVVNTATASAADAAEAAAMKAVVPLLTITRLEDRLARGAAYTDELAKLNVMLKDSERSDLAPLANGGPDNAMLTAQIDAQQRPLLAAYRESLATDWLDKIYARLSSIITIVGPKQAHDPAADAYLKLRAQVMQNDVIGALATLQALPQVVRAGLQAVETALTVRARAQAALGVALQRLAEAADQQPQKVH